MVLKLWNKANQSNFIMHLLDYKMPFVPEWTIKMRAKEERNKWQPRRRNVYVTHSEPSQSIPSAANTRKREQWTGILYNTREICKYIEITQNNHQNNSHASQIKRNHEANMAVNKKDARRKKSLKIEVSGQEKALVMTPQDHQICFSMQLHFNFSLPFLKLSLIALRTRSFASCKFSLLKS